MTRFTAACTLYLSTRSYMTTSSPAARNSGPVVTPQQGGAFTPPCSDATGACYPDPFGNFLSICPCDSPGTCGPCFDLSVEGFDLGNKHVCLCSEITTTIPCCPPKTPFCCGDCLPRPDGRGSFCKGQCIGPGQHCP